jgi:hypothetical protein
VRVGAACDTGGTCGEGCTTHGTCYAPEGRCDCPVTHGGATCEEDNLNKCKLPSNAVLSCYGPTTCACLQQCWALTRTFTSDQTDACVLQPTVRTYADLFRVRTHTSPCATAELLRRSWVRVRVRVKVRAHTPTPSQPRARRLDPPAHAALIAIDAGVQGPVALLDSAHPPVEGELLPVADMSETQCLPVDRINFKCVVLARHSFVRTHTMRERQRWEHGEQRSTGG